MHEDKTMMIAVEKEEKPEPTERRKALVSDWKIYSKKDNFILVPIKPFIM